MKIKLFIKTGVLSLLLMTIMSSCSKNSGSGGAPTATSLSPDSAAGGNLVTLIGAGLSDIRKIIFDNDSVSAAFNPNFNTDHALLFRVPDTANGGAQNIIFVKSNGQVLKMPFKVIALPSFSTVSNYDFYPGDQITISGNNLNEISKVVISGTSTEVNVISSTKKALTIKMPQTTAGRIKLDVTNASGTSTTSLEFVNINNAYALFLDNYQNGVVNASWGPASISNSISKTGTASFAMTYAKGNWSADGFAYWGTGIPDLSKQGYNFLTFWIKGGSQDYTLYLTGDKKAGGGYGNSDQSTPINVSANVWNYIKLPLETIKLWANGSPFIQIGLWIKGPDGQDETFYLDDMLFVK